MQKNEVCRFTCYVHSTSLSAMCAEKAQMAENRYNRVCDPKLYDQPVDIELTVVLVANTDHFCWNSVSFIRLYPKIKSSHTKRRR